MVLGSIVSLRAPHLPLWPLVKVCHTVRQVRKNLVPLRIEGYGWDVDNSIVFLANDEARWITGVVLPVDAGRTAGQPLRPGKKAASAPVVRRTAESRL